MIADIASGNADLADWLFAVAAVLFLVAAVLASIQRLPTLATLTLTGFALIAAAWLVL